MSHHHNRIRPAAVAGLFYPGDPAQLSADIQQYLDQTTVTAASSPKAIIAPHAGYVYSGPVAASAYKQLIPMASSIQQVVLLGPSHRVPLRGIATPDSDFFSTPLGEIKIDNALCEQLEQFDFVAPSYAAHQQEHSLEVHLPFLQHILGEFALTPLVVGDCSRQDVSRLLESIWGTPGLLVIISSDLSHYEDYQSAVSHDRMTSSAIERLEPESISVGDACGRYPLNGLLDLARNRQLSVETLDLRNSGDTAGSKDRVVGYGAYVVH